ncbi:metal-dependent hydrolase [Zhongshania aliphaticivorans]|uniref:metal-dependent hydrolase n=1 Tax=Zhongshania aliphaticivorans TaxID=1470434 RepID=UPI0012E4836D|nr:metal-dependent hydrolase [Zhongshania aliphaticivorans]CAA0105888.1 Uncharacterised protein [Zhongshania aliphaticivorans]
MKTTTLPVNPVRRDLHFKFDSKRMTNWHPDGAHASNFYNTLSVFFPEGEQFFIDSVRHYRDNKQITDKKLLAEISAFIGQEAMHGREHRDYNAAIADAGLGGEQMDAFVGKLLRTMRKVLPPSMQLGGTCALEHLTASLAGYILEDESFLEGAEENMAAVWQWHALEETEHKGVCYDVYEHVVGQDTKAYAIRGSSMIIAMSIFWSSVLPFWLYMNYRSGAITDVKGWRAGGKILFGRKGIIRHFSKDFIDYFRRDFHPWDHDNSVQLKRLDALAKRFAPSPKVAKLAS